MKARCGQCGSVQNLDSLPALDEGFGYHCARCGGKNLYRPIKPWVDPVEASPPPVAIAAPVSAPPAAPLRLDKPVEPERARPESGFSCPKCGHVQEDRHACHRCGLVFERAKALRFDPLEGHPRGAQLQARWEALRGDLDDDEGHRAFISLCEVEGALEFAGRCYRREEGEDPRVAVYRQLVIAAALAQGSRLEGRALDAQMLTQRRFLLAALGVLILGISMGFFLLK